MRPFLGRVLLVIAFLLAQHAAMAHALSHAAPGAAAAGQNTDGGTKDRLCDFHAALGTVAGAVCGSPSPTLPVDVHRSAFQSPVLPGVPGESVAPASRGPPLAS